MRADTWEGELNGPVSPSTVRENIEVRFLFYSVAAGWGYGQEDKEEALLERRSRGTEIRRARAASNAHKFPITPQPLIWPVDLGVMKTLPTALCAAFLN